MFSHDCAGKSASAAARRDILRGPNFSAMSSAFFGDFPIDGEGFSASSGMDLATQVPAPTKVSRYPSASNCSYAFKTGMREIFNWTARLLVEGTRCPGRI
jgi:hypothetical protein